MAMEREEVGRLRRRAATLSFDVTWRRDWGFQPQLSGVVAVDSAGVAKTRQNVDKSSLWLM